MSPIFKLVAALLLTCSAVFIQAQERKQGVQPARAATAQPATAEANAPPKILSQRIVREGIAVEFSIAPLKQEKGAAPGLPAGTQASISFKITDSNSGQPLTNLRPSAWIDASEAATTKTDMRQCREKIQSFLQASLTERPDIDLNTYLILTLNEESNISVLDPLAGFGGSKLYTLLSLSSPGEDWVMTGDHQRLFVTMPLAGQIAVVDTANWKVLGNIDAGAKPTRIRLQRDEKYLWVGNDADDDTGGLTVVDWSTMKAVASFRTGPGRHDIALSDDDRHAYVSNRQTGTLSIIDIAQLKLVKEIKTGAAPTALAFSPLSKAVYVVNEDDGVIVAIGGPRHETLARINAKPGLSAIRFPPGGRYGFVLNRRANMVHIFDSATNRLLHNVPVGPDPDQIIFTPVLAYVRARGDEFVSLINLSSIGKQEIEISVNRFPAGQLAPQASASASVADAMIPAPEQGAVLVANPADKMIYYYMEGMAAPMGNFQNYRRAPRAVLIWNRSLRETSPGTYTTTAQLGGKGGYDVPFLLDSPRLVHCFDFTVKDNPDYRAQRMLPIRIEPLIREQTAYAGEQYQLRFKAIDALSNQPRSDLKDVAVLTFLAPGIWQQRGWAKSLGGGLFEITFVPPQAGVYYIYFKSPSLGIEFNQLSPLTIQAVKRN